MQFQVCVVCNSLNTDLHCYHSTIFGLVGKAIPPKIYAKYVGLCLGNMISC